ncbi:MAG: DUF5103 domain-containing protein [Flavobacteriales bacterium]
MINHFNQLIESFMIQFRMFLNNIVFIVCTLTCSCDVAHTAATSNSTNGNEKNYYEEKENLYQDKVFNENIKTVQLHPKEWETGFPAIRLKGSEQLMLRFDDLEPELKNYQYTVVHCDFDWKPSGLGQNQYIDGFYTEYLRDYKYSINTFVSYINYELAFPNEDMGILLSGNYVLIVFLENAENPVITKRFVVYEEMTSFNPIITKALGKTEFDYLQQIDFTLKLNSPELSDPFAKIKTLIMQNEQWSQARTNLKPQFVKDRELVFVNNDNLRFDGYNEYRFLDLKNLRQTPVMVQSMNYDSTGYRIYMKVDESRRVKYYITNRDINGKYVIRNDFGFDARNDADYCMTTFRLKPTLEEGKGNFYLYGQFTDWAISERNLMRLNEKNGFYEITLPIKQGYYNYAYAYVADNSTCADLSIIEGSHAETENAYTVLIYFFDQSLYYYRAVGFFKVSAP